MAHVQHISPSPIPRYHERIPVIPFSCRFGEDVARHLETSTLLGVSMVQSEQGDLTRLILATETQILSITPDGTPLRSKFKQLLLGNPGVLTALDMDRLALRIYDQFTAHVVGVNLSTLGNERQIPSKMVSSRLGRLPPHESFQVNQLWHSTTSEEDACKRAWISVILAQRLEREIEQARRVDTRNVKETFLPILCRMVQHRDLLAESKPKSATGHYDSFKSTGEGFSIVNSRYKTRIKPSSQTRIAMYNADNTVFYGRAGAAKGKTTNITSSNFRGELTSIQVLGVDDPTNPEKGRDGLVLRTLIGDCPLWQWDFVRYLWQPSPKDSRKLVAEYELTILYNDPALAKLNPSQKQVVLKMTTEVPLAIVHGPPGTGKTTTIAAAAKVWQRRRQPAWIIAHSNVAVKNIAEKLFKEDVSFKIIVSKEFHFEWHEHLYHQIDRNLIRTDELPDNKLAMERLLEGSEIILSTLSSLSNPSLDQCQAFELVPLERLVVDEASQINIFEYMVVFDKFRKTLRQTFYFGDPKQLPPFGKENVPGLECVFDIQRLTNKAYFLDTQYRMPTSLGKFISNYVYGGRLKSQHPNTDPTSVVFIDVSKGHEEKRGTSWVNPEEINVVVQLVRDYYRNAEFCIITPYDAQRAAIESALKTNNLPWENNVFNVDSFQGNERKYVLISVVRTNQTGFLRSEQRLNVMLTRCQAGMVIVSNKGFLTTNGRDTLLGKMALYWSRNFQRTWVDWKLVSEQTVNLPGAPGRNASGPGSVALNKSRRPTPRSINYSHSNNRPAYNPAEFPTLPVSDISPPLRGRWRRGPPPVNVIPKPKQNKPQPRPNASWSAPRRQSQYTPPPQAQLGLIRSIDPQPGKKKKRKKKKKNKVPVYTFGEMANLL